MLCKTADSTAISFNSSSVWEFLLVVMSLPAEKLGTCCAEVLESKIGMGTI